jgi:hypothetical protein
MRKLLLTMAALAALGAAASAPAEAFTNRPGGLRFGGAPDGGSPTRRFVPDRPFVSVPTRPFAPFRTAETRLQPRRICTAEGWVPRSKYGNGWGSEVYRCIRYRFVE